MPTSYDANGLNQNTHNYNTKRGYCNPPSYYLPTIPPAQVPKKAIHLSTKRTWTGSPMPWSNTSQVISQTHSPPLRRRRSKTGMEPGQPGNHPGNRSPDPPGLLPPVQQRNQSRPRNLPRPEPSQPLGMAGQPDGNCVHNVDQLTTASFVPLTPQAKPAKIAILSPR